MHKPPIIIQCIVIFFISSTAYSFSSSSYLIANSAMSLFDYEEANTYYENSDIENLNDSDLEKHFFQSNYKLNNLTPVVIQD